MARWSALFGVRTSWRRSRKAISSSADLDQTDKIFPALVECVRSRGETTVAAPTRPDTDTRSAKHAQPTAPTVGSRIPPCPNEDEKVVWNSCQGTRTSPEGDTYVGEWKDDMRNGRGTRTWPNGVRYVGQWKEATRETVAAPSLGRRTKIRVGGWKDDMRNGQGTHIWPNGEKYVGEWKETRRNGQGTLYAANGSIISSGIWADDAFVGAIAREKSLAMEKEGGTLCRSRAIQWHNNVKRRH